MLPIDKAPAIHAFDVQASMTWSTRLTLDKFGPAISRHTRDGRSRCPP